MTGLCECGCGKPTRLAPHSDAARGWIKGEPVRFVYTHQIKTRAPLNESDYDVRDMGHETPCWMWRGCLRRDGYGEVCVKQRHYLAHRLMWEQTNGPVPTGLELDHLCRVTACIRPAHLEAVTHRENMLRGAVTKLTEADREAIRRDTRRTGLVAADYGVGHTTIRNVRKGR